MSTTSTQSPHPLRSISALIGRLILGGILIAHGLQKLQTWGPSETTSKFEQMGAPMPELTSQIATWVELVGGILIVLGLLVRFLGPILFIHMLGAVLIAHRSNGVFASDGGFELPALVGAAGLLLAAAGAGAFSLDHLFMAPFRARRARKEREQEQELAVQTTTTSTAPNYGENFQPPAHVQHPAPVQHDNPVTQQSFQQPATHNPAQHPTDRPTQRGPIGSFDKADSPRSALKDDTATEVFRAPRNDR